MTRSFYNDAVCPPCSRYLEAIQLLVTRDVIASVE